MQVVNTSTTTQKPQLIIPSRLDSSTFHPIQKRFSNHPIILLAQEDADLCPEVMRLIEAEKFPAFSFNLKEEAPIVGQNLRDNIPPNAHIIYIPAIRELLPGTASQITTETLQFLCELGFDITPIGVHHTEESTLETIEETPEILFSLDPIIPNAFTSPAEIRKSFYHAISECYSRRPLSQISLGELIIKSLKNNSTSLLLDGSDDSELTYEKILAASLTLAKLLKKKTKRHRIAIALPPGKAGTIINIATVLAGKVPVNLNFTASRESLQSAIRQSAIDLIITATPLKSKCSDFPWDDCEHEYLVDQELPKLQKSIKQTFLLNKLRSADNLIKAYKCHAHSGNSEAALLFTSGSSGEPKGVPLSHYNIISNICQSSKRLNLPDKATILGCLPLFHSFGMTWTMWFPLLAGHNLVTFTSPIESKRLVELVESHSVNMLVATPTFLRGYLRHAKAEQFKSLNLVITGAEKLPSSLTNQFEKKFNIRPLEGYGLTETSPGTNVNLPQQHQDIALPTSASCSVGQPLPGLAMNIESLSGEDYHDPRDPGEIILKGPNVFQGYLNKPSLNDEILKDGWFRTGDIGYIDDNGFLHISGRISRFSKIAGEMVPHEVVEEAITKTLQLEDCDTRPIVIMGLPDEKKGEKIVLLSTVPVAAHEIRLQLIEQGMPALWAPKEVYIVDHIPILASGKLNIKGCKTLLESHLTKK